MATNNVINKNNNIIAGQQALYTPQVNCTGDGTIFKIPWDNGDYDNNSGFDIPTRSFIAPIAGAYLLNTSVAVTGAASGATYAFLNITTTSKDYLVANNNLLNDIGPSNSVWISGSVLAWMAAGDSAFVTICARNGTKTISLTGYAAGTSTSWFNWFLVQVNGLHA